jgi:hypothetical protein
VFTPAALLDARPAGGAIGQVAASRAAHIGHRESFLRMVRPRCGSGPPKPRRSVVSAGCTGVDCCSQARSIFHQVIVFT